MWYYYYSLLQCFYPQKNLVIRLICLDVVVVVVVCIRLGRAGKVFNLCKSRFFLLMQQVNIA